jgi:hypothetical protein
VDPDTAQRQIRAVGADLTRFWMRCLCTPAVVLGVLAGVGSFASILSARTAWIGLPFLLVAGVAALGMAVVVGLVLGALAGVPLLACYGLRRRQELRRTLAALPREQLTEILLPLREEAGETGALTAALIRDLRVNELVPAPAPAGRGDEPTPNS